MADQTMDVCEKCGVVRAARKVECPHCHAPYGKAVQAPSKHGDDFYWVCLEVTFKCRMCGFHVPLNHLDMDGAVVCAKCGLEQAFEVAYWGQVLNHAQNTGDVWGDEIGEGQCSERIEGIGENDIASVASPGYPRCGSCHAQLDVTADGLTTAVSCGCGEKATYEIPKAAIRMMPSLRALVADEHRADRKAVKDNSNESAIAVACPSCNAPLEVSESSKFVTCGFCKTTSRIPNHTWFRISGKEPKAEPMWLLFQGESRRRRQTADERARDEREGKDRDLRQEYERKRAADRAEKTRREDEEKARRKAEQEAEDEIARQGKAADDRRARMLVIVLSVVALGAITIGAYLIARSEEKKKSPADDDACAAGDGRACMRAGDIAGTKYPRTRLKDYELACNANYAMGCTKRADFEDSTKTKVDWYRRGCTGGDQPACDALDKLYMAGQATPKDPLLAKSYLEKRCAKNEYATCTTLGANAQADGEDARAVPYLKTACEGGDPKGCNLIGHAYESGKGTKVDNAAMLLAYQTACKRSQRFCYDLGRVYDSGIGVQKNQAKAIALYTQACSDGNDTACGAVRK